MSADTPAAEALAALDQIIDGFTSFRDAFAAAIGASTGGGEHGRAASGKPAAAGKRAAPADEDEQPAGKGAGKKDTGGKKGKKAEPVIDFETLKDKFLAFTKEHGVEEAKTLLGTLGVKKLGELTEDQYADAMAGIEAAESDDGNDDLL